MLRELNTLVPLCLTFVSAILIVRSFIVLKLENVARIGKDPKAIMENLAHQQADAVTGSAILFASFIWQLVNLMRPTIILDWAGISLLSVVTALVLTIAIGFCCCRLSKNIGEKRYFRALSKLSGS